MTNPAEKTVEQKEQEAFEAQMKKEQQWVEDVAKRHNVPKVYMLKVPVDDTYKEFTYGFIKYPDRVDVSIAMTMKDTDPLKGKEIVLRNSWLEGDMRILDDTELFLSATTVLDDILAVRRAIVKKNWMSGQ